MRKYLLPVVIILIAVSFWSCNEMPNGGLPVYIQIDSASVQTNGSTQGSGAHKISDVWVTVNGKAIGTFEYPTKIPVLANGDLRVQISAGIKDNGVSNTRVEYPFYDLDEFEITDAQSTQTYVHNPVFKYISGTVFPLLVDFEGSNFSNVTVTNEMPFEGGSCGKISLNASDSNIVAYSAPFDLPNAGLSEVYVELNYKCTGFFECGMLSSSSTNGDVYLPKITFQPRDTWNKTYLNFSNEVGGTVGDNYRLYFRVAKLASDPTPVYVWLDNIKVVTRQ